MKYALALATTLASPLGASDFSAPNLKWPVDCILNHSCHLQQYVDHDPGPGAQDFHCNTLSYDGHKGTDIALPSLAAMEAGVTVRAAADGVVAGIRNNMVDQRFENGADLQGRDCGNGVVLKHSNGWETQYCHLKQGSVQVKTGQSIAAGTPLGEIGLSGKTQFPHLHLSVRHNGTVVDPFAADFTTCGAQQQSLWDTSPPYAPGGLITVGFSNAVPSYDAIRAGTAKMELDPASPALVLWGYLYGSQKDDLVQLQITGPQGELITHSEAIEKPQAQLFRAAGKRLRTSSWPIGTYHGTVQLVRDGVLIDSKTEEMTLR